jgi:hypothetical protein
MNSLKKPRGESQFLGTLCSVTHHEIIKKKRLGNLITVNGNILADL